MSISKNIINISNKYWIDKTLEWYAKEIIDIQKIDIKESEIDIYNYLANHMNICNYIRLDKMQEAKNIFEKEFKRKEIVIDKIGIRNETGDIIKTFSLKS